MLPPRLMVLPDVRVEVAAVTMLLVRREMGPVVVTLASRRVVPGSSVVSAVSRVVPPTAPPRW